MSERTDELYEAASRYYVQGETMDTIARALGTSRSTVSRLLSQARDEGIVQVSVRPPLSGTSPAARAIAEAFGITVHLAYVGASAAPVARLEKVTSHAASVLSSAVADHHLIGVAWGVTMRHVAAKMGHQPLRDATVVQINGSAHWRGAHSPYVGELFQAFGRVFDAHVVEFPVPAFFDFAATKEAMWRERSIRYVLELQAKLDVAVFGLGALRGSIASHVYATGYLDDAEVTHLRGQGVVGDVCTVLLRADGTYADVDFNSRASGLTPAELARVPRRIAVVADPMRAAIVLGSLRAGCVTDLVCDDATAAAVAAAL